MSDKSTFPVVDVHLPDPEIPNASVNSHGEFCFVDDDRDIYESLPIEFPMVPLCEEARPIAWLWPGRIPLGMVTFLEGSGGSGKSFVALDMAARVTCGAPWPGKVHGPERAGDVLLLSGDPDGWERVILPRLMSAGADLMRVGRCRAVDSHNTGVGFTNPKKSHTRRQLNFPHDLPMLEYNIRLRPETRLVIIDQLPAFCNNDRALRATLLQLEEIAERRNVAIVVTARPTGRQARRRDPKEGDRRAETVRSVFRVLVDLEDDSLYHLAPVRTSFCAEPEWLPFRIGPKDTWGQAKVAWGPPAQTPPESALPPTPARERGAIRRAVKEWLLTALLKSDMPVAVMVQEAKKMGFSEMTLRRAREELKVRTFRDNGGPFSSGWWTLRPAPDESGIPPDGPPDPAALAKIQNWEGPAQPPQTDAEAVIIDEILRGFEDEDVQRHPADVPPAARPGRRRKAPPQRSRFSGIPDVLWERIRGPFATAILATGAGGQAATPPRADDSANGTDEDEHACATDQEGENSGKTREAQGDQVSQRSESDQAEGS
jgi:hypothetical protein